STVNYSVDMDLSLMAKGVYFLKFINKQQVYLEKVIVK
ncbi:MAG: T9SS type A sorting domain-containing protein, partial [Bacteroidales bacterium]|nr:T9SS type A sorting domain-containing protein [Bacteroidales bacterium]